MQHQIISNTFGLKSTCSELILINQVTQLPAIIGRLSGKPLILGAGSNVILNDLIQRPVIKLVGQNIKVLESTEHYIVEAESGVIWDELVKTLIREHNVLGLENLAAIPGTVGAAPVQNIGAYGVEISQFIESVYGYNLQTNQFESLSNKECEFSYRDSVFKSKYNDNFIITSVSLKIPKKWSPKIEYANLNQLFTTEATAAEIFDGITALRWSKLPIPSKLGNAGSFFKNPVVENDKASKLKVSHSALPIYKYDENYKKIPAAWLIESLGFKGKLFDTVGMYEKQALVMCNYQQAKFSDVVKLKNKITDEVYSHFGILLEAEPRFIY